MDTTLSLRAWRLHLGFTQKELSLQAGLTQSQISSLERLNHAPSIHTLEKLAKGLGLEAQDLFRPPPGFEAALSRHEIDAIAEAVVSGQRTLKPEWNRLADAAASLISRKLNAYAVPGKKTRRGKRWGGKFQAANLWCLFPELPLTQILSRVDRKLT